MREPIKMDRREIEALREQVRCETVLEISGFALDHRESTRRAIKYRKGAEIVIVTHAGRGWFDPLGDEKGDVFALVVRLERLSFFEALDRVGALVGVESAASIFYPHPSPSKPLPSISERWTARSVPWVGSATWRYLLWTRALPAHVVRFAVSQGALREGPKGSIWAAHRNADGHVCGWEERGPEWRGFASGGAKSLFELGDLSGQRICVTEAAIDAMSLAAIEGLRVGTRYLSTGGGWSPNTETRLRTLAKFPSAKIVAATDANDQGDAYADRLRRLAEQADCSWLRLRPPVGDWNDVLVRRQAEKNEERVRMERQAGSAPAASREALPGDAGP